LYDSYEMTDVTTTVKRIAVLGSTGSIGRQTLEIVRALPDRFRVIGLAAGDNLNLLEKQINEFKPELVYYRDREIKLSTDGYRLAGLEEIAVHPGVDIVVVATSGKASLNAVLAAIKAGKKIALANKEPLVMAGEIIMAEVKKKPRSQAGTPAVPEKLKQTHQAEILPVDSEHSAIWQCMNGEKLKPARIILTASGGPFLRYTATQIEEVTPEQALKHPSWKMGKKVTIDSATLMNKGLEVIEAHWLFGIPYERIDILVHPQSIVHSMVEMEDGSIKAQMSCPDMRFPIQYALSYPDRLANPTLPKLNWDRVGSLNFELPDYKKFPCLKIAIEAGKQGGTYPAVLSAADEVAVDLFLNKKIPYSCIAKVIERVLERHQNTLNPKIEDILAADEWARVEVNHWKS
jgi:1-deoxy-D-xylulose-5-phosphate reductoisomerase